MSTNGYQSNPENRESAANAPATPTNLPVPAQEATAPAPEGTAPTPAPTPVNGQAQPQAQPQYTAAQPQPQYGTQPQGAPVPPQGYAGYQANTQYPPQGQPQYTAPQQAPYNQKSALAAGLLGIFLGSLGVHNFYLGRTSLGVTQLLITVLSLGFLSPVSAIWGFVEGILYLVGSAPRWNVDGDGYPLAR